MKRNPSLSVLVHRRTSRASRRAACGALGLWAWSNAGDLRSAKRRGRETRAERGRRGSTLVVVMALLGMLLLLGVIYFTFSNQEQQSATYFAEAAKKLDDPGDDIDAIFDAATKELIQGADATQKGSALFGGRSSLLFTMLGHDLQPYSGSGVNLIFVPGTGWVVDQDGDGADDLLLLPPNIQQEVRLKYNLVELNDSPAARYFPANPQLNLFERNLGSLPAPDVDYTAADHNNPFLAYEGWTWDFSTTPPTRVRVIKPSFHRPELFRSATFQPVAGWATAAGNGGRSFRPHPDHLYVWRQGNPGTVVRRFVSATYPEAGLSSFPFQVDVDGDGVFNEQGVWDRVSGNAATNNQPFEYDVDTDGDNERDAIWMDLDLPVLVRPTDNATYIPMIAFKVIDLDSKLNLNAIGNLSGDTITAANSNFGNIVNPTDRDISISSMGLSSWEINPMWALDTQPSEVPAATLNDHTTYFHAPTTQRQLANMEWWWLNKGRVKYPSSGSPQIFAGRYGEANRMWNVLAVNTNAISVQQSNSNLFPFPGVWDANDNRDGNDGGPMTLAGVLGGQTLPWKHPMALNGRGSFWTFANPKQLDLVMVEDVNGNGMLDTGEDLNGNSVLDPPTSTGLIKFLRYTNMGVGADGSGDSNVEWSTTNVLNGVLMQNTVVGANFGVPLTLPLPQNPTINDFALVDDPTELTLESKYVMRPYDEPLDAVDTLLLHMSKSDRDRTGVASRVADLMPGNIVPGTSGTQYQLDVAKRFTTVGSDLKTFAMPRLMGVGPDGQPGQAGVDDNQNQVMDDIGEMGWPGSDDLRAWEFNVDYDGNGLPAFPPQYHPVLPSEATAEIPAFVPALDPSLSIYRPENAFGPLDPFRPQLRRLLNTEFANTGTIQHTFRLSINEFLDVERVPGQAANPQRDPLFFRPLTPHSTDNTLTTIPNRYGPDNKPGVAGTDDNNDGVTDDPSEFSFPGSDDPAYPPTDETEREIWARLDRQQMARDIYVMLYTFCGGDDNDNMTSASGLTEYPANTRRMMAQFAVNMVDALDRDNVITAFEYDNDLANGWNLDDDATTNEGSERGLVFGVEAQQLTFSEVAWYRQLQAADNSQTPYNETDGEFNFVQIELRSIFPQTVQLADPLSIDTDANTGIWRLVRDDSNGDSNSDGDILDPGENAMTFATGAGSIAPGGLFTIASSDSGSLGAGGHQASAIYIDHTGAMTDFELVAPNKTAPAYDPATGQPNAVVDLDLLHPGHANRFALVSPGLGNFLSRTNSPATNTDPNILGADRTVFRLQRRLNPRLPKLSLVANPFITVDTFDRKTVGGVPGFVYSDLAFNGTITNQAEAALRLPAIEQSSEREQPLDGVRVGSSAGAAPSLLRTTLTALNLNSPATTNLHQIHRDRDFASVIELFDIPLHGPDTVTRTLIHSRRPPETPTGTEGQLEQGGPFTFGAAILVQNEDINHNGTPDTEDSNSNGVLDSGEDGANGLPINGQLDHEDFNGNSGLDNHPNHFHRLLSLIEVPTRSHRQLGDPLKLTRVPGKLNLNGINDPRILASLIDDRQVISAPERDVNNNSVNYTLPPDASEDLNPTANNQWDFGLPDVTGESGRDWWFSFLEARDGIDPTSGVSLPMTMVSRPFRDMGLLRSGLGTTVSSVEDTVLRKLPISTKGRRLFEIGDETDFDRAPTDPLMVDPTLRHRLLSKVVNNTSTRSNCFLVFVTIGMFECKELPNGATRVGAPMDVDGDGTPDTHRAVFVIDRSIAEEAYDKGSKSFDWKKLILAKQRVN